MNDVIIRAAKLTDLDILHAFHQGLVTAERPFDPTIKDGTVTYYNIAELIQSPDAGFYLAELDTEVIGCGYAKLVKSKVYLKHVYHAHLGFMYVNPEHRGRGVNRKIIGVLKKWSFARGVTEIRLEVYAKNSSALKAYEKTGFAPHMLEMRMKLA
jgi:GNAT superfamily N-acetyltransferase